MLWCNKCRKHYTDNDFEIIKEEKGKKGKYYPYRDTMEAESYTYTEVTLKCSKCGEIRIREKDEKYSMSKTDMEKYGYKGANYGC